MVASVFLPILIVLFGLAIPRWVQPDFDQLHAVVSHWLTRLVLLGLLVSCCFMRRTGSGSPCTTDFSSGVGHADHCALLRRRVLGSLRRAARRLDNLRQPRRTSSIGFLFLQLFRTGAAWASGSRRVRADQVSVEPRLSPAESPFGRQLCTPMLVQPPNPSASCWATMPDDPGVALRLALGQAEMGDLRGREQHRRAVGAGRDAGATADAGRRVERTVGIPFRHRVGVRIWSSRSARKCSRRPG